MSKEELQKNFKKLPLERALALFRKHKHKIKCWNTYHPIRYCSGGGCITDYEGELHHIICGMCVLNMKTVLRWDKDG